jgi:hydroxyacylglutathione hydrolase
MEIHRAEHPMYLSNAYLVVDDDGRGVLIDGHGEGDSLLEKIDEDGIEIQAILLTHHHGDHVDIEQYRRFGVPVYASEETAAQLDEGAVDETLVPGQTVEFGGLSVEPLSTPGHARGHLALRVNDGDVFTADVLFKGTVGGSRAPGATGFDDLRASVMETLMQLPPDTRLHPGHKEPTTVADEAEGNIFVRAFRGEEDDLGEPVKVAGEEAELLIWGPDYDGTNKAWVRFPSGEQAIVGGSQVERGQPG